MDINAVVAALQKENAALWRVVDEMRATLGSPVAEGYPPGRGSAVSPPPAARSSRSYSSAVRQIGERINELEEAAWEDTESILSRVARLEGKVAAAAAAGESWAAEEKEPEPEPEPPSLAEELDT
jgi:hypothetical protein